MASGSLRQKDPEQTKNFKFIAYTFGFEWNEYKKSE